jgi:hypothetical protein
MNPWRGLLAVPWMAAVGCGGSDFGLSSVQADASVDSWPDGATSDVTLEASPPDAGADAHDDMPHDANAETGAPDAQPDGPTCSTHASEAVTAADGVIIDGSCHGSISFLSGAYANVGAGRGLLRFTLGSAVAAAFHDGRVVSARITLARNQDCEGESSCPAGGGVIAAYPLRNDWDEGTSQPYSGADWCRRLGGNPGVDWNAPGANADHGDVAAEVTVDASQANVVITLDPSKFTSQWVDGQRLSVLLIPAGATFVFATRESNKWPRPRLEIEYCE